ncbi:hypothetical protein B0T24DRAFT_600376 [Lasiosphaeria ovina]|uniref:Uncharacterized protein n=1 Tax=Lasiosphaeria ovina TaxID=92902 RepID=A0AAE0NIA5_9PEZI|nr:hypothetical protein B0T24DRAFT_600376 [Lasiosphaeria ovina]
MPRNATLAADDSDITIRLKHGVHTVFLSAMVEWSFSRVTSDLLEILRERYPRGLTTSIAPPKTTPVPASDTDAKVVYALPNNTNDLSEGWSRLCVKETDTLADKRLKDMSILAFALLDSENKDDEAEFDVELPILEDEGA